MQKTTNARYVCSQFRNLYSWQTILLLGGDEDELSSLDIQQMFPLKKMPREVSITQTSTW